MRGRSSAPEFSQIWLLLSPEMPGMKMQGGVVDSPSVEMLKTHLDAYLCDLL